MMTMTGIDGCKSGWIAVMLAGDQVRARTASALDALGIEGVTGIDMPLGLLGEGWRTAGVLARRALGRRGASVFAIPPRGPRRPGLKGRGLPGADLSPRPADPRPSPSPGPPEAPAVQSRPHAIPLRH